MSIPNYTRLLLMTTLALLVLPVAARTPFASKPAWEPGEFERVQITLQSYRYFQAVDRGDYPAAFGTFASAVSARLKFKEWKQKQQTLRQNAGADLTRTLTRITWYPSPDTADPGRVIAAASFSGRSKNMTVYCGRLLWQRTAQGSFELIAEEGGFISPFETTKLDAKALQRRRNELGCLGDG